MLGILGPGLGQAEPPAAPDHDEVEQVVAPDSPLASMTAFLDLCRRQQYEEAAHYLESRASDKDDGPELARRLKAVLDRRVAIDLAALSPQSGGYRDDGLARNAEELGTLVNPDGSEEPVHLSKRLRPDPRWVFSKQTVSRIDSWYGELENRWLLDNLPPQLLRSGPLDLPRWQWLALPLVLLAAWFVGYVLARLVRGIVSRLFRALDAGVLGRITGPLTVLWAIALLEGVLPSLGLHTRAEAFVHAMLRVGLLLVVFWGLARIVDVAESLVLRSPWAAHNPSSRALLPLGRRITKAMVVVMALLVLVSALGYPVASLLAGLGIGGLAVALAAQKTVENLFGAFSIGADQPFREGDFVRIEDFVGTVEEIGLRSTKIRTLDRTLVSLPNGKLAEMRLESLTARDRLRLACTVTLVYGTSSAQLRAVLEGLEQVLRNHPLIWEENVVVRFVGFGASSLDIEVMAWFQTSVWAEFQPIRQDVLIAFMEVVESAGTSFAFPTRTVHIVSEAPTPES